MKLKNYTFLYLEGFNRYETFLLENAIEEQNVNSLFNNRRDFTDLLTTANVDQLRFIFYKIINDLPNTDISRFLTGLIELTNTQNYSNASQEIVKRFQDNYGAYINPSNTPTVSKVYKALQEKPDLSKPPRPLDNFGAPFSTATRGAPGTTSTPSLSDQPPTGGGAASSSGGSAAPAQGSGTPSQTQQSSPTDKEKELFKKLHNSDFDPESPVDRKKLEQLRQAAQQVGTDNEENLAAAAYRLQYVGNNGGNRSGGASSARSQETEGDRRRRLLSPVQGMYVRTGFNQFRPAVQADLEAKTPLFMQNPNPVFRQVNPYVQVDRAAAKARKATKAEDAFDREMRAKGAQKLGPGGIRTEKGGRKERKSQFGGVLGSLSNLAGDVGNTLTGR